MSPIKLRVSHVTINLSLITNLMIKIRTSELCTKPTESLCKLANSSFNVMPFASHLWWKWNFTRSHLTVNVTFMEKLLRCLYRQSVRGLIHQRWVLRANKAKRFNAFRNVAVGSQTMFSEHMGIQLITKLKVMQSEVEELRLRWVRDKLCTHLIGVGQESSKHSSSSRRLRMWCVYSLYDRGYWMSEWVAGVHSLTGQCICTWLQVPIFTTASNSVVDLEACWLEAGLIKKTVLWTYLTTLIFLGLILGIEMS